MAATVALVASVAEARAAPLPGEPTLPAAQWKAIQRVVTDQLRALKAGNAAKAFSFASPGIRAQFGTPDNFIAMVRSSYDALLVARYTEFLEGAVVDGRVIQPLRLFAPDNTVLVALYTMEKQKDGRWKIAGCVLAPSTVQAASFSRRGSGGRAPSSPAASA
jgi:Domain of unknown function (DUF4864)